MKKINTLLVAGAIALACSATANANLITNGSFENNDVSAHGGTWELFSSSQVDGWVSKQLIEIQTNSLFGAAAEGKQYVELDSNSGDKNKWVFQNFGTVVGQTYEYSFSFSGRQGVEDNILKYGISSKSFPTPDKNWERLFSETSVIDGSLMTSGTDWLTLSGNFVATSDKSRIWFKDAGTDNSLGTYVDNVNVAPVPEPATMLLFGTGLIGLAGFARRKKK